MQGTVECGPSRPRFVLFAYGFRPFFLASGIYAIVAIGAWLWVWASGQMPLPLLPPQLWHGHEMLFGFVVAAIAGFLLTAVPSWTGERGFGGLPLIGLTALWLAGRLAFFFASSLPGALVTLVELAFLPSLALLIAPPLLRAKNRNTPLLAVLAVFWLADVAFLYAVHAQDVVIASTALRAGINLTLLLITVIGGRIIPAFTANALRNRGIDPQVRVQHGLDMVVIASMVLIVATDIFAPQSFASALLAAFAALAHALRLAGWRSLRTVRDPIVWVLHLAYAWLPVGLALKAIHLFSGAGWSSQWLHALTFGAAMMIVAVVTRASLGHTGRPLKVSRTTTAAYIVLAVATLIRVFGTAVTQSHSAVVQISGALWLAAFVLILIAYAPIWIAPRADGKPG